jgi:hypothetical protein
MKDKIKMQRKSSNRARRITKQTKMHEDTKRDKTKENET